MDSKKMTFYLKTSLLVITLNVALITILGVDCNYEQHMGNTDFFQREHSLLKPYQGSGMTIPNWEFFGSTIVTSNYIRITQDSQSRQGGIWNTIPYQSKYWEIEVGFKVHGRGSDLYGDGFALWYVKDPPKGGPIFGNVDYFTGLAVILDTYANYNSASSFTHPKISVMVNNGTLHYDHEADGVHTELGACESKFRGLDGEARILIRYYKDELSIKTDLENNGNWVDCVSVKDVYLPSHYHFGITAATGDLSDNHDILSIKMKQLSQTLHNQRGSFEDVPRADYSHANRDRANEGPGGSMSALRKLFIIVCVIAGVVAVAGFGYFLYSSKKSSSRKRFY